MRITWRGLELPTILQKQDATSTEKYGRFFVEPFERGFGTTIGNSLRRVLLSSLEGSAVTSIKIAGVDNEFSSIKGVMEDVTDIVLNLKSLILRSTDDEPTTIKVSANKAGQITAGDIEAGPEVEIVNKDLVLATLTDNVKFEMEMEVENGRGYLPANERIAESDRFDHEVGRVLIDAIFSPVARVRYKTEDTRVGQRTNYDRLILEIWTDGTVTPELALVEAAKILRKHINPFVQYFELGEGTVGEEIILEEQDEEDGIDEDLERKLNMPIEEMEFSVRASNCLESAQIDTVGKLASLTEAELLKFRSFGKTSLREIRRKLADMGLSLGMTDIG